ncbi:dihydrodipicolinate synthase family protein [Aliiroseovarius sp. 2305UL8-7]|uniref:dihydrodipicolinate synthase family protein n=1 Tax=Aliiroseovarius conchicola TaxID=3121637 RepID=UPI003528E500
MKTDLNGMYSALLTGFDDEGRFCSKRQSNIIDYVARQGLQGLYIGGSSGESGLMSTSELLEQQRVIAGLRTENLGNIIAHVGQPSTIDTIALAKQAAELGFDALSALPPHSYPFSDDEILTYYSDLAAATDLPIIVYEIPLRTNRPLPKQLLLNLLDLPNVQGIKFTSTDLFKLSELRRARPDKIYYFGFDEIYVAAAALGHVGGIGTTYNVFGKLYVAAEKAMRQSDVTQAQALQNISQEYVEILIETGVVPGVKLSLEIIGYDVGSAREPMSLRSTNAREYLSDFLGREDVKPWLA